MYEYCGDHLRIRCELSTSADNDPKSQLQSLLNMEVALMAKSFEVLALSLGKEVNVRNCFQLTGHHAKFCS
jgi:hypothetical protein